MISTTTNSFTSLLYYSKSTSRILEYMKTTAIENNKESCILPQSIPGPPPRQKTQKTGNSRGCLPPSQMDQATNNPWKIWLKIFPFYDACSGCRVHNFWWFPARECQQSEAVAIGVHGGESWIPISRNHVFRERYKDDVLVQADKVVVIETPISILSINDSIPWFWWLKGRTGSVAFISYGC